MEIDRLESSASASIFVAAVVCGNCTPHQSQGLSAGNANSMVSLNQQSRHPALHHHSSLDPNLRRRRGGSLRESSDHRGGLLYFYKLRIPAYLSDLGSDYSLVLQTHNRIYSIATIVSHCTLP